jgi:transcriptional regulator of acetoin/glycerol metabolism
MARGSVDATVEASRRPTGDEGRVGHGRLYAVYPAGARIVVDLGPSPLILGRDPGPGATITIDHPTVSRRHLEIRWDTILDGAWVRDLGSRNGSWAGGIKVDERPTLLAADEVLRVGDVLFVLERGATLDEPGVPEVSSEAVPGVAMSTRRLRRELARAAPDLSPVLILGATGTGKERVAQEVHRLSRRPGLFVAVNCATLGAHLIESQLFGHVKGAFTGAQADHEGLFVAAKNGTLFLDEIGVLPLELQPKLLRAIQEKEIRPVGSNKTEHVDVRIVAATHANLAARAQDQTFRQDLYARLSLWQVAMPSIAERRADILSWIELLHRQWCKERDRESDRLTFHVEAAEALLAKAWPENLRGLGRLVHELAVRPDRELIRKESLPKWVLA